MELEDDLFFADLSKEIALLIMDEDEDPLASCPPDSLQVLYYFHFFQHMPPHILFFFLILLPIMALWEEIFVYCNNTNKVKLIFRLFLGQFILLHSLLSSMSMLWEEKAKGQVYLSLRQHSQEGSRGKEGLIIIHMQNIKSSLKIPEWLLKFLTRILSNPEMAEDTILYHIDPCEKPA